MNRLKKFPHAKIEEQLEKRRDIPEYQRLLMECKVSSDDIGVVLDTSHPSWKRLQLIVKQHEQRKTATTTAGVGGGTTTSTGDTSSLPSPNSNSNEVQSSSSVGQPKATQPPAPRFYPLVFPKCELATITSLCIELFELNDGYSGSIFQNGFTPESIATFTGMFSPLTSLPDHLRLKQHISIPSIRRLCFHNGVSSIPNALRALVWAILLEVDIHQIIKNHQQRMLNPPQDGDTNEEDQTPVQGMSVIKVDIHRTYPQIELFASAPVQKVLEKLLAQFCRRSGLDYKQGMNYLLATLILVCTPLFSQLSIQDVEDASSNPSHQSFSGNDDVQSSNHPSSSSPSSSGKAAASSDGETTTTAVKYTPDDIQTIRQQEAFKSIVNCEETAHNLELHSEFIIQCLMNLITKLLPNTYSDRDFGSLQCLFMFFRLLLQYHDPVLSNYVDQYEMTPEFYASPWFLTLHVTRTKDVSIIILLWDSLFLSLREDPMLHYFVSLALLIDNRESLLQEQDTTLPEALSKMCITTPQHLSRLLAFSNVLRNTTPPSASRLLHTISTRQIGGTGEELAILSRMLCIEVGADEALSQTLNSHRYSYQELINSLEPNPTGGGGGVHQQSIPFLFIDSRTQWDYMRGHLSASINFPLAHLQQEHAQSQLLRTISGFTTMHVCVIGDGIAGSSGQGHRDVTALTSFLISNGVRYVSVVANGFIQIHRTASILGVELVNHNADQCPLCQNPRKYEQLLQQQQQQQQLQIEKYARLYRADVASSSVGTAAAASTTSLSKTLSTATTSSQKNVSLEGSGSGVASRSNNSSVVGDDNDNNSGTTITATPTTDNPSPKSQVSGGISHGGFPNTSETTGLHPHTLTPTPSMASDGGSTTPSQSRGLFSSISKLFNYPPSNQSLMGGHHAGHPTGNHSGDGAGGAHSLSSSASLSSTGKHSQSVYTPETSPLEYDIQQQQLVESQRSKSNPTSVTTSIAGTTTTPLGGGSTSMTTTGDAGISTSISTTLSPTASTIRRLLPTLSVVPPTLLTTILLSNLRDITVVGAQLRQVIQLVIPSLIDIALDAYQPSFSVWSGMPSTGHEYRFMADAHPPQMARSGSFSTRNTSKVSSELWTSAKITTTTTASSGASVASGSTDGGDPKQQHNVPESPTTQGSIHKQAKHTGFLLQAQLTIFGVVPKVQFVATDHSASSSAITTTTTEGTVSSQVVIAANEESLHGSSPIGASDNNGEFEQGGLPSTAQHPTLAAHRIMSSVLTPIASMFDFLLMNSGVIEVSQPPPSHAQEQPSVGAKVVDKESPSPPQITLINAPSGYQTHYILLFIPVLSETTAVWVLESIQHLVMKGVELNHIAVISFVATYQGAKQIYMKHSDRVNMITLAIDDSSPAQGYRPVSTVGAYAYHASDEHNDVTPGIAQLLARIVR